jgi:hypothetical protein
MIRSPISLAENTRRGMVTAQIALSMGVLMGMLALLVDGGLVLVERRHAQATADAAALAAASDIYTKSAGTASASANSVANDNGYTSTNSTVTVNNPPLSGNFTTAALGGAAKSANYVEVIVTYNMQRGFSAIFGSGTIPVSARAVAQGQSVNGAAAAGLPGILLLGNTGTTLSGVGNGTVSVTDAPGYTGSGGSVYVDSTGPNAVSMKGNADTSAPSVYIAQSGSAPAGVSATSGSINMGATPLADPLAYLPAPSISNPPPGISVQNLPTITNNTVLTSNTIYIAPAGGLSLSGNASITGTNVMIYVPTGSINLTGNGIVNLSPMTSGPYQGVTLFQDPSNTSDSKMAGNGNLNVTGTIYAPAANLTDTGNGATDVFGSQIIANSLTLKGNGTVNLQFDPNNNGLSVPNVRAFGIVE